MSVCRSDFLAGLKVTVVRPTPVFDTTKNNGTAIKLNEWRTQLARNREAVLGQHGIYLDASPTGAGKSHADIESARIAEGTLVVMPTHENAAEVEADMRAAGIEAMKYPRRSTEDKTAPCSRCDQDASCPVCGGEGELLIKKNCESETANRAESWGLSVVAAVCPTCPHKAECQKQGYRAGVLKASGARVSIATHARATYGCLQELGKGREHQVIHEDCLGTLRPMFKSSEPDLAAAKCLLEILLNDPRWLNWFGCGETEIEREQRGDLYGFTHHMLNVAGCIEDQVRYAERTRRINLPAPKTKPPGIEWLLFQVAVENDAKFTRQPLRILLAAAAGECFQVGVLIRDQKPKRGQTEDDQDNRGRSGQPTDEEFEPCAL